MKGEPPYVARFFAALEGRGAAVRALRYARPAAGGDVQAFAFTPSGKAPRSLVLLVHATGNDALYPQLALIQALLARHHAVFCFDLDGHGRGSSTTLALDVVEDAVPAAIAAAKADPVLGPAASQALHLVGQSLGGALALSAAASGAGAAARSLTLISAPLRVAIGPAAALGELLTLTRPAVLPQTYHYGVWGLIPAIGPLKRATYPVRLAPGAPRGYVTAVVALIDQLGLLAAAPAVRAPALLIYGARDLIAPPAGGAALQRALPAAELALVPRATHFSTIFEPGVLPRIVEFIDARTPGGSP